MTLETNSTTPRATPKVKGSLRLESRASSFAFIVHSGCLFHARRPSEKANTSIISLPPSSMIYASRTTYHICQDTVTQNNGGYAATTTIPAPKGRGMRSKATVQKAHLPIFLDSGTLGLGLYIRHLILYQSYIDNANPIQMLSSTLRNLTAIACLETGITFNNMYTWSSMSLRRCSEWDGFHGF
jgi:hypothetical protein